LLGPDHSRLGDVDDVAGTHDSDCTCPAAAGGGAALELVNLNGGAGLDECADATYGGATVGACQA